MEHEARRRDLDVKNTRAHLEIEYLRSEEERLLRAQQLSSHFAAGAPTTVSADDVLASEVAIALRTWQDRPVSLPPLTGPSVAQLADEIARLPVMPSGDLEPDPGLMEAASQLHNLHETLTRHRADQPGAPPTNNQNRQLSEGELIRLAEELELRVPPVPPELQTRIGAARRKVTSGSAARSRRAPLLAAAGALALVGLAVSMFAVALAQLNLLYIGMPLLALGIVVGLWAMMQNAGGQHVRDLEELRIAEEALRATQYAVEKVRERRQHAEQAARAVELPADPVVLRRLAREWQDRQFQQRNQVAWDARREQLTKEIQTASRDVYSRLRARGVDAQPDDLLQEVGRYFTACRQRASQALAASRRDDLTRQHDARAAAEAAATDTERRREQARLSVIDCAMRLQLAIEPIERAVESLSEWQAERSRRLGNKDRQQENWTILQQLLGKLTLPELEQEVAQRRQWVAHLVTEAEHPLPACPPSTPEARTEEIQRLDALAREAAAEAHTMQGQVTQQQQSLSNVVEAEEALERARDKLAQVKRLDRILDLTRQFMGEAQDRVNRDIAPVLASKLTRRLARVTAQRYDEAQVDPERLEVKVRGAGSPWRDAALLSHGTAEQIYLLLRVALAEILTKSGEVCPLILDEPTTQFDAERTQTVLNVLLELADERQVVLFSQEPEVLAWAEQRLAAPRHRLARLPGAIPLVGA